MTYLRCWRLLIALGACLAVLALAGCGGKTGAATAHTPTPHKVAPHLRTPTSSSIGTPTAELPTPTPFPTETPGPTPTQPTATPQPTATKRPTAAAPRLLSASLSPATVGPGDLLSASVSVRGSASSVEMYLSSGPGGGGPITLTLAETSPGTWVGSRAAPLTPGTYHYTVGLYDFSGNRTTADNDNWNVTVTGNSGIGGSNATPTSPPAGPQPLPADIPLAPPFSYGNPVAATFSADGEQIQGSEVVSNSRPDIPGSTVSDFYSVHFPRAGWTISSGPGAGASSFTMVATSGNRVCVVQYSGGTVQIFYGSTPVG